MTHICVTRVNFHIYKIFYGVISVEDRLKQMRKYWTPFHELPMGGEFLGKRSWMKWGMNDESFHSLISIYLGIIVIGLSFYHDMQRTWSNSANQIVGFLIRSDQRACKVGQSTGFVIHQYLFTMLVIV